VTDFEKLSELGEGVAHLCAVAGDVDNLGDLFKDIWKDPKGCLANLMTASRLLNHFFAGEMEHTLQNSLVYTVYAGGDDFFYIGKWNEVLKNISQWRKRFRDFIGLEKPSFSAGLYICHHHTPIHRMHEAAEEQLNRAKGKELCAKADYIEPPVDADCKPLKDRVALWGKVMRWEEDWKEVVAEMEQLDKWLKSEDKDHKPFNSAFYYRLLGYARRAEATRNGSCELEDWMFVPHLRYDLGRNVRDKAPDADFQHFYDLANLKEDNKTEFFKTLYRVPLMWALYLNRN